MAGLKSHNCTFVEVGTLDNLIPSFPHLDISAVDLRHLYYKAWWENVWQQVHTEGCLGYGCSLGFFFHDFAHQGPNFQPSTDISTTT